MLELDANLAGRHGDAQAQGFRVARKRAQTRRRQRFSLVQPFLRKIAPALGHVSHQAQKQACILGMLVVDHELFQTCADRAAQIEEVKAERPERQG